MRQQLQHSQNKVCMAGEFNLENADYRMAWPENLVWNILRKQVCMAWYLNLELFQNGMLLRYEDLICNILRLEASMA